MRILLFMLSLAVSVFAQEIIDISVKGISDKQNEGAQQDRLEAILDAKRQACEKAGLTIESKTTVENFEVVYDFVETQAATVLLPGFQLIDIGYVQDGTYQVVLSGKIKVVEEEEQISAKELRYAKSLRDRGKHSECEKILTKYIDSEDKKVSEELKEEAFYYFIKWGYAWDMVESYHKFAAYYPDSKYLPRLEAFAEFAPKPLYQQNEIYKTTVDKWQKTEFKHNDITFTKTIIVLSDTILFKNFRVRDQSLLINYHLFSTDEQQPQTAFHFLIQYYDGDIKQGFSADAVKSVIDYVRVYQKNTSPSFQYSSSGKWFGKYRIKSYQIKGNVPRGEGPFEQSIQFDLYQKSF